MAESTNDDVKRLEISKYPNRRYYDKTRSRHLTLEEIYAAIREGYEVTVLDSKTGDDITPKVLAQIILELDSPKLDVFPVALLHRLLRANEQLVTDFTQKYFSQALMTFLDSQKKTEQYLRQAMGLQTASTPMTDWAKMMWGTFNPAAWVPGATPPAAGRAGASSETPTAPAGPSAMPPPPAELIQQLAQLQQQVSQLQHRLAQKQKPGKSAPRRRGKRKKES
jgi:polyhydroxyalkanoate synthesis repressor PhaR